MKLYTYVNYAGNCKEAFHFYEKHLGGKITFMMTHGQGPAANMGPEGWKDAILHARISIGESVLMGADIPNCLPTRSSYLTLMVDSNEEAERIYAALGDGGEELMPMAETFFAFRFGQVRDRFGTAWMIIHERPRP
jgi:PhnB protein